MKALTIQRKSAKNGSGLERFHCISRTKEEFNNLGCFQRATLKVNDVLNEVINRGTKSKGTNVFLKTSQSAFPTSSLFFMNFDLNYFFTSTHRVKVEIRKRLQTKRKVDCLKE